MSRSLPIRIRLTAWYTAILAATFLVLGIVVWIGVRQSIDRTVDADLISRIERTRTFLTDLKGGETEIIEELTELAALASAGTEIRLTDRSGAWLYQSPGTGHWSAALPANDGPETIALEHKKYRLMTATVPIGRIQIGAPLDGYQHLLANFAAILLFASPIALFLASTGGYWMSGRALRPVDRIARLAGEISAQRLSARLPVGASGDELDRLSTTLNAMFERLEGSFRSVTQFTADASHELRTPAAIIRATAELASARPRTSEEHSKSWKLVLAESERTALLLDDLMTLARADADAVAICLCRADLAGCAREAVGEVAVLAESADVSIRYSGPEAAAVLGDAESLRRVCLILLDNAIKYSPPGGNVDVSVSLSEEETILEVRDTGIGIELDDLPHIFNRFYRASKDRSRKSGGTGLGLAIAQRIVEHHAGRISAVSLPGQGSCFQIRLPSFMTS